MTPGYYRQDSFLPSSFFGMGGNAPWSSLAFRVESASSLEMVMGEVNFSLRNRERILIWSPGGRKQRP